MDLPPRQIQNNASPATPAAVPASNTKPLESQQISPAASPPAQPADFLVDLISSLLVSRADAASILASVASRIAISSNSVGEPGVQPGTIQNGSVAPEYARLISMQNALSQWYLAAC